MFTYARSIYYILTFSALIPYCSAAKFVAAPATENQEFVKVKGISVREKDHTFVQEFKIYLNPGESSSIDLRAMIQDLKDLSKTEAVTFAIVAETSSNMVNCLRPIIIDDKTSINGINDKTYFISGANNSQKPTCTAIDPS